MVGLAPVSPVTRTGPLERRDDVPKTQLDPTGVFRFVFLPTLTRLQVITLEHVTSPRDINI